MDVKTDDVTYRVTVYLVAVDPGLRVGDVRGPYDASEFGAIELSVEALFANGPEGREVHRVTGAESEAEAREKARAASAFGPGEPRERR